MPLLSGFPYLFHIGLNHVELTHILVEHRRGCGIRNHVQTTQKSASLKFFKYGKLKLTSWDFSPNWETQSLLDFRRTRKLINAFCSSLLIQDILAAKDCERKKSYRSNRSFGVVTIFNWVQTENSIDPRWRKIGTAKNPDYTAAKLEIICRDNFLSILRWQIEIRKFSDWSCTIDEKPKEKLKFRFFPASTISYLVSRSDMPDFSCFFYRWYKKSARCHVTVVWHDGRNHKFNQSPILNNLLSYPIKIFGISSSLRSSYFPKVF